jgi:propionate CoA-transferase
VLYITEQTVFSLTDRGIVLREIAPGVDLNKDEIARMGFRPIISDDLLLMDHALFR